MKSQEFIFLRHFGVAFGTLLFSVLVFVIAVDPYALYNSPGTSATQNKYRMTSHERVIKPKLMMRRKAEAVILGSSRAAVGLSAATLSRLTGRTAFNHGITGAYLDETLEMLKLSVGKGDAAIAVIGLDYFAFTRRTPMRAAEIRDAGSTYSLANLDLIWRMTASINAALDSAETIVANLRGRQSSHEPLGQYVNYVPHAVPAVLDRSKMGIPDEECYQVFQRMLDILRRNDIRTYLFVSPTFHGHQEADTRYQSWIARLEAMTEAAGFRLMRADINEDYTTSSSNFLDGGHYTSRVGDRILTSLLARSGTLQ